MSRSEHKGSSCGCKDGKGTCDPCKTKRPSIPAATISSVSVEAFGAGGADRLVIINGTRLLNANVLFVSTESFTPVPVTLTLNSNDRLQFVLTAPLPLGPAAIIVQQASIFPEVVLNNQLVYVFTLT